MKICDVLDLLGISQSKLGSPIPLPFRIELENWFNMALYSSVTLNNLRQTLLKEDVIFYSTILCIDIGRAGGNGRVSQQQVFVRVDQESDQATHQSLQHNQQDSQQFSCSGNFCLVLLDKIV